MPIGRKWLSCAWLVLAPLCALAQMADEYAVKAQFLANFALFTDWPANAGPELIVCVQGVDIPGAAASKIDGRKVGERTLVLRRLHGVDDVAACRMVFIGRGATTSASAVIAAARGKPIVTVAESEGAAQQGVMINLLLRNDKVSFEINAEAARQAGFAFSAKLLKLAVAVY